MPRRTTPTNFGGFGGFSPDGPNPFIRLPSGMNMLMSDINDAGIAMDLSGSGGGTRGGPTVQVQGIPSRPAQPSRGLTGDNSNAGFVNRNPLRHNNQANRDWWETRNTNPNRPHSAMDFGGSPSASAGAGRALDTGASGGLNGTQLYSPAPSETFDTGGLHNYGEPSVEITGFPDQREWWNQSVPSSNNGGAIWSDDLPSDPSGAGAVSSRLFQDDGLRYITTPNVDPLTLSSYQTDGTYLETPRDNDNSLSGLNTYDETAYQPTVDSSDPFELNVYDETRYTNAPADNDNDLGGLHSYGYPGSGNLANFGGNMSLGPFLNTPLSDMRYGEGYPQIGYGGRPSDLQAGEGYIDPGSQQGGTWVERSDGTGSDWVENATSNRNDVTGTTTFPIPGQFPTSNVTPEGMRVIGTDTVTGAPIYQDSQGNRFVNPGTGTPISAGVRDAMARGDYSSAYGPSAMSQDAARNMAMANWGGIMGSPLRYAAGDAGRDWFGSPSRGTGYVNPETNTVLRNPRGPGNIIPTRGGRSTGNRGIGGMG